MAFTASSRYATLSLNSTKKRILGYEHSITVTRVQVEGRVAANRAHPGLMGRAHYRPGKPKCKQEFDQKHEHVLIYHSEGKKESWQILFMDLTLVALLINLSHYLFKCGNTIEAIFVTGNGSERLTCLSFR